MLATWSTLGRHGPTLSPPECVTCNFMLSEKFAVGGHLYLGKSEWIYVPHRKNPKRHQETQSLAPRLIETIALRKLRKGAVAKLAFPSEVDVIEIRAAGSVVWSIIAPDAELVVRALRERAAIAA
jgi:hypothetical protein